MGVALERFPYGIYVLGIKSGERINAMIASWVTQAGSEPLVAFCVKTTRLSHSMLSIGTAFSLALLRDGQAGIVPLFKGEKSILDGSINGVSIKYAGNGAPVPEDCLAYVEGTVEKAVQAGDHTIFVARVEAEKIVSGGEPLMSFSPGLHVYTG